MLIMCVCVCVCVCVWERERERERENMHKTSKKKQLLAIESQVEEDWCERETSNNNSNHEKKSHFLVGKKPATFRISVPKVSPQQSGSRQPRMGKEKMSFLKGLWQSILNFIGRHRNEETYRSPYVNESVSKIYIKKSVRARSFTHKRWLISSHFSS